MSAKDFINYRNSLSYTPPTPEEAISTPYTVLSYGMYGYYFQDLKYFTTDDMANAKNALIGLLQSLHKIEEEKENRFFINYRTQIAQQDKDFLNTFDRLYTANKYSQLITEIEKRRRNLIIMKNTTNKEIDKFAQEWTKKQEKIFRDSLKEAFKSQSGAKGIFSISDNAFLNRTFKEILDDAEQRVYIKAEQIADEQFQQVVKDIWIKYRSIFMEHLNKSRFGKDFTEQTTLRNYRDSLPKEKLYKKQKDSTNRNIQKTVKTFVEETVNTLMSNNIPSEILLDIGTGTIRTGDVKRKTIGGGTVKLSTSNIELFSEDIELQTKFQEVIEEILQKDKKVLYEELNKLIDFYSQDNFIIHYSAKNISKKRGADSRIHIKGTSSNGLASRIAELQQIASLVNAGDIESLIFAIVNAGNGGVMEKDKADIRQAIIALCATWMFDDYMDTFEQINTGVQNNKLHIYFINGNFYTVSNILSLVIEQLTVLDGNRLISLTFSPSKSDPYEEVNHDRKIKGIPRWNYVVQENIKRGSMQIRMNTKILEDMLLNL